jgi:histone-lysine N-methyltransferase SUV420H
MRHFAIYEVAWPRRVPPPGAMSVTPQEESVPADINTKNVTKENLSVIDNHIAAAASSSTSSLDNDKKSKKRQPETEPKAERDSKRRRSEVEPGVARKPNIIKITYSSVHKRGMNVTSLTQKAPSTVKVEELAHDAETLVLKVQPRGNNGRFARKGNSPDVQSTVYSRGNNGLRSSPRRKRANQDLEEPNEVPRKRSLGEDEQPAEVLPPIQKVFPRRSSGFRAGRLFSKPNPQQFALKAWSGPIVDDSSEEEESHLLTPEDDLSPVAEVVDPDESGVIENDASRSQAFTRAALSCINPSPLAFAKSRWNSYRQPTTVKGGLPRRKGEDESYNSEGEVCLFICETSDGNISCVYG